MSPQRQIDIVLDLQIFRIRQIFNLEESLHLCHAFRRQVDNFILFINDKISRFFPFHAHNGVHLRKGLHIRPPL